MAHTLFHDVGVETLYTDYSIGYIVRPMHKRPPAIADRHYADEFVDAHAPRTNQCNGRGLVNQRST